ncbi:MAG: hypothetical protein FD152_1561 [Xanthobacteraceae bacterium]|nr:MAG: hypothetical protein FD152_1561 [Xanthobacteraceae bacterium]
MTCTLKGAAFAAALTLTAVVGAAPAAHAGRFIPVAVGGGTTVKWTAVGIIGIAGILVTYDIMRRFGCTGDFLRLGGPGFTSPIGNQPIMPPRRCTPAR